MTLMRCFLGIALIALTASVAAAQDVSPVPEPVPDAVTHPDTVTGVDAFLRGDYTRAAEVLRPVVEAWPSGGSDDAAAFFLASLYDTGLGVPQDRVRACALYERAGASSGPVGALARAASTALQSTLNRSEWSDCVMLVSVGTGHRFEPVRITLADDYWVSIDLRSNPSHEVIGVVSMRGKQKRTTIELPVTSGMVFFPVEFTELQVDGVSPGTRRFVEVAAWIPSEDRNWNLAWAIVEVVGAELVPVTTRFLSTVAGPVPPDDLSLRLRELVDVRVNDAGEAEWAILGAPDAEHEVIETPKMRRELDERDRRRRAADDRIKGDRPRDPNRAPSLTYADADGCGNVLMSGWTADRTEWIAVRADSDYLQLSTTPRTFDLSQQQADLEVVADVFDRPHSEWGKCTDIEAHHEGERQETWRAVAGTATIQLQPGISARYPRQYRATVQIDNAEFLSSAGARVRSPRPIRLSAVTKPGGYSAP